MGSRNAGGWENGGRISSRRQQGNGDQPGGTRAEAQRGAAGLRVICCSAGAGRAAGSERIGEFQVISRTGPMHVAKLSTDFRYRSIRIVGNGTGSGAGDFDWAVLHSGAPVGSRWVAPQVAWS